MRALINGKLLTDPVAQPGQKPFEIYDTRLSGFVLRVQPTGRRDLDEIAASLWAKPTWWILRRRELIASEFWAISRTDAIPWSVWAVLLA